MLGHEKGIQVFVSVIDYSAQGCYAFVLTTT